MPKSQEEETCELHRSTSLGEIVLHGTRTMPVEYANRNAHWHNLQLGSTQSGEPRYYSVRKLTGTPVEDMRDGYESYESPEAR
jgi:hypothetical protein